MPSSDDPRSGHPPLPPTGAAVFEVTPAARERAAAFFAGREKKPLRVYVSGTGGDRVLALALDRVRTTDAVYEIDGVTWVLNRDFLRMARPVRVDHSPDGFALTAAVDLQSACAGCKSAGTCGR